VKELRDLTGAGMMECKHALVQAEGDGAAALRILRERGFAKAQSKSSRETTEGAIFSYVHSNNRIGVLIELACETDFVARNPQFHALGKELAMQVAASGPLALRPEDLPQETIESEKAIYLGQCAGKPETIRQKIVEGKMRKFYDQVCLLRQAYIRDDSKTVQQVVQEAVARIGENIAVRRFVRLEMGA
jgi:elongation factor Ts